MIKVTCQQKTFIKITISTNFIDSTSGYSRFFMLKGKTAYCCAVAFRINFLFMTIVASAWRDIWLTIIFFQFFDLSYYSSETRRTRRRETKCGCSSGWCGFKFINCWNHCGCTVFFQVMLSHNQFVSSLLLLNLLSQMLRGPLFPLLYPLKISENPQFSNVLRGNRKERRGLHKNF